MGELYKYAETSQEAKVSYKESQSWPEYMPGNKIALDNGIATALLTNTTTRTKRGHQKEYIDNANAVYECHYR